MNSTDILDVLYATMHRCDGCCMDDATDRNAFADTFAMLLAAKAKTGDCVARYRRGTKARPLRKSVMVRK